jgi:hypothetical protein
MDINFLSAICEKADVIEKNVATATVSIDFIFLFFISAKL